MAKTTNTAEAIKRFDELRKAVEARNEANRRSAWARGVGVYALDLLDGAEWWAHDGAIFETWADLKKALLNGADSWKQYSEGGCALCYNCDIAERLCNPSELKKTANGAKEPNAREGWLDVQARALYQAGERIKRAFIELTVNA